MRLWPPLLLIASLGAADAFAQDAPPPGPGAPPVAAPSARPPTAEQAADAVLAAVAADDRAALRSLAAGNAPDPWEVADELIRRGKHDAADAFARAAPRIDVEALPRYVASRKGVADDPARRERLARALAALAAKAPQAALDALGAPAQGAADDVVAVRIAMTRGSALDEQARALRSARVPHPTLPAVGRAVSEAYRVAAEGAEKFGWLAMASGGWRSAAGGAFMAGDLAAALEAIERRFALSVRRKDPVRAAEGMQWAGDMCRIRGDYATALRYFTRALETRQSIGDGRGAAVASQSIGLAHLRRGEFADAIAAFERARDLFDASGDRVEATRSRAGVASVLYASGEYARALEAQRQVLASSEALGYRLGVAGALSSIGSCQFHLGAVPEALETFQRAAREYEALGQWEGLDTTLGNVATAYARLGEHERARETYERVLGTQRSRGDEAEAAATLANLGSLRYGIGDLAGAAAAFEEALASQEARGEQVSAANTRTRIAGVHLARGDFAKAIVTYERALATLESQGDRAGAAFTLAAIGRIRARLGDLPRARAALESARALQESIGDRPRAAVTTLDLAAASLLAGEPATALEGYERAVAELEAVGDRRNAERARSGLGDAHLRLGDPASALALLGRAAAAAEADRDPATAAGALQGTGMALRRIGRLDDALRAFERALALFESLGDRAGEAEVLGHLGETRADQGDVGRALAHLHASVAAISWTAVGLADDEGAGAREGMAWVYDVGIRAGAASRDPAEVSFFLESGRAGALLEGLRARAALGSAAVPAALRLAEAKVRTVEANAVQALRKAVDAKDLGAIKARRAELDAAREQVGSVVARLQREAKAAASLLYPQPATLAEVRATLGDGDAMVLYALPEGDAAALVVTRADARVVPLGPTKAIVEAVDALALDDAADDPAGALAKLSSLVTSPLALPAKANRVLVSPAGALSYVPFAPLLPGVTVAYVPSGTTYRLLLDEKRLRGEGVLALGDPDYDVKVDEGALAVHRGGFGRLVRLPATREEAKAVGTETLLGLDATEARLREALSKRPRWRAVHLACHGLVDVERPALSSLAVTPAGDDDGFLTCLDVFRTKIPSDLVVLSACETGKGKVVRGEGILGLTRAFMFAGSPRVLCSLWKVDDEATRALMTRFYALWNPKDGATGLPTAEALRKAQEHVRSRPEWKHPYYWAAWVLWGLPS